MDVKHSNGIVHLATNPWQKPNKTRKKRNLLKLPNNNQSIPHKKSKLHKKPKPKEKPVQANKKRCFNCNKKTGLLGIECKCGYVFCNGHRLPEDHACTFDHQMAGKKKLQKEIIKIYNGKIESI